MKFKTVAGCLTPVVVLGGAAWYGMGMLLKAPVVPVRLESATKGDVEVSVTETGAIEPLRKVEVKSKVAGRIAKLMVDAGDQVVAGQLLATIDPTEINSQVAQMQAQLEGQQARLIQSRRGATMQVGQTTASVAQALASLKSAQARLLVADEQLRVQPELNSSDVAQAEANWRSAQQAAELLAKSTQPQALVEADTNVQDAEANEQVTRRNLERQRILLDKGFVSEQVVDTARSQHAAALARLDQAKNRKALLAQQHQLQRADADSRIAQMKAALDRARSGSSDITVRRKQVEAARSEVAQAQAQLDLARAGAEQNRMKQDDVVASRAAVRQLESQLSEVKVRQGDTSLVAPMSGTVTRRYMEEGELVTSAVSSFSSGTPVFQVGSLERMIVKMTVNEVDVYRVKKGLPVEIRVDGARGEVFKGRVRKVAPASQGAATGDGQSASAATGAPMGVIRFSVEIEMVDPADAIRPGMSARCTIIMARHKNVLRVPANCVQGKGDDSTVQVATETKTAGKTNVTYESRKVKVGLRNDSHVEILSGLKEGEKLKPGEFAGPKRASINID